MKEIYRQAEEEGRRQAEDQRKAHVSASAQRHHVRPLTVALQLPTTT